ncbi:hypothetical protein H5410_040007 [Solanum commersonii]|uniref:Uncharacterized protein n=1 Tax=Solanum commersonii TaxID=4109 RepID=A0A9J5XNU2_SOLCO|nr:hypothetical protein H5410_040007 [Solanum commersonii]
MMEYGWRECLLSPGQDVSPVTEMIPWHRISGQPVTEPDEAAKLFECPLPPQKLKPGSCCHDKDERVLDSHRELTLWARAVSQSEVGLYARLIDCHLLNVQDVDRTHDCMLPRDLTIFCRSYLTLWQSNVMPSDSDEDFFDNLLKFIPTSLNFYFPISDNENVTRDYLVSIHRELYYWRSCKKIRKLRVWGLKYEERYAKDVDIWVHFATRLANSEDLELGLLTNNRRYEFPQFAYKTASLRNLVLWNCRLNPFGNVNGSSLVSLSNVYMGFTNGVMEKDEEQNLEKEFRFFKEILHSVAHVENLNLGSWCIECLSILELTGWEFPPSSQKFLELGVEFEQLDFPGICCFLQSSLDLETLVIDWYDVESGNLLSRYINEDEQIRRFESHNFNGSFPYLKTIKILNFYGFVLPLVKYLLKHAIV